ncbi:DUF1828 domain-containing protein [Luteibacter aegosomatissinici]|uniref:DUF1828 domain-containing protein n=1 Tax=Luteibacter aegosomatissinici TaxID=2911539 RepID=UPI001FFA51B5|nr:DUF1828 domain-containing protein [Luteibacter aegosomatissinici]UPG96333.1 DUF1828 domain-containing protein [Luteibacter aegosomatissinici]
MSLPNGSPIDFYLINYGDRFVVTDDGLWLFALRSLGYSLEDRRNWRGLAELAATHGFSLCDDGSFEIDGDASRLHILGGSVIRMICALVAWEKEHYAAADSDLSLNREVERLMRLKAPLWPIEKSPIVRLPNGQELRFDFKWGTKYVDAIAPIPLSVSSRLRKILQMQKELMDTESVLFIVDDRAEPKKATQELAILAQVSKAITLSDFDSAYIAA